MKLAGSGLWTYMQGPATLFFIWPPGAELLGARGGKMGILAVFEGF